MEWLSIGLAVIVVIYFILPKMGQISLPEAATLLQGGALFLDVRTKREFDQESIPGSRNIPLQSLESAVREGGFHPDEPVLVFCQSGVRSGSARRILKKMGFTNVGNVGSFSRACKVHSLGRPSGKESTEG